MTQCLKARNEGRGQKSSDDCHSLDETEKKEINPVGEAIERVIFRSEEVLILCS